MPKNVIVIAGPTASGKSRLAIDLAKELNGVIVNADASQVYSGIPIIAASPSAEDKQEADHRLYEYLDVAVNGNVYDWLEKAVSEIRLIWQEGKLPIVVGGGGLYLDNLINGTTPIPEIDKDIRSEVVKISDLYNWLLENDELGAKMLNPNDTTRVKRAAEIFLGTGKSIAEWYNEPMIQQLPEANFRVIKIIPQTEELDKRCYLRFDKMIKLGALDEVRWLDSLGLPENLPAMKMLGVPDLRKFLHNECSLAEAVELAKLHTRQYAKRQRTWFRNKLKAEIEVLSI